jgi:hypothetical protein
MRIMLSGIGEGFLQSRRVSISTDENALCTNGAPNVEMKLKLVKRIQASPRSKQDHHIASGTPITLP